LTVTDVVKPASPAKQNRQRTAHVIAVQENLVGIETQAAIIKNEVAYIELKDSRLKSEVLRIHGNTADLQVYEDTRGVVVGDQVTLTGELLSVVLGPGLLGQVFDGLQNPLAVLASRHGFFLKRGADVDALAKEKKWAFTPLAKTGEKLQPGQPLGVVQEGRFAHKIMVPFEQTDTVTVSWIQQGTFTVDTPIARIVDSAGVESQLTMERQVAVRRPLPQMLIKKRFSQRLYPDEPLNTTIRIIDTFFPIARGGTACVPGPFGAGKTVLQNLLSRYSSVDIVIVIACGERAGEVVETITEFPQLRDPQGSGTLMDRTIIIANTSSMPVAARESSIYTGITLGEYYRQMGYQVLVIADSTSRWAQAMRETSGRMEEIPGEEAFPAYLDSTIKSVYERAGVMRCGDGSVGSLTLVGTVSPAGGNFEEPVTQATLTTVKTFLGLSSDRAYKRYYPAVEPLLSWSRYVQQLRPWYEQNLSPSWTADVEKMLELLRQGDNIYQMMQVTGEEGISLRDFVVWQKSVLLDMVYLQQDAFDPVDGSTEFERQKDSFYFLKDIVEREYRFEEKNQAREFFTRLTGLYKNYNYSVAGSDEMGRFKDLIEELLVQYAP
jgi:V/A-type H+-transporting ATPase subunit A